MTQKLTTTFCFMLFFLCAGGQTLEKINFNQKNPSDDYYMLLNPASGKIKGVLVLMPGYGELAESVFPETKLFNVAFVNDILTVAIAGGQKLYADDAVIDRLNRGLTHLMRSYPNVPKENFVIGGFSAGGSLSLRYAEYCMEHADKAPLLPRGVFAVDSPIDLASIYEYFEREVKKNYSPAGIAEAKTISETMRKEIGTPDTNPKRYAELTPFDHRLEREGNEKYLKTMAVRTYEDVDVEWLLKERRRSLYDANTLNASDLINRLLLMGNEKAEFITSKRPGYRSNGMRHPHSWSIVDEVECIQWVLKLFDGKN